MSFREDLTGMWGAHPEADDGAGRGHDLCASAQYHTRAWIDLDAPRADGRPVRWRAAPLFVATAAHAIGDALIVGSVLVRFFAFVAPLVVRFYLRRLWVGLTGTARRTEDPRRAAGTGAVAVRAQGRSDGR
jgi:hypothetical protein